MILLMAEEPDYIVEIDGHQRIEGPGGDSGEMAEAHIDPEKCGQRKYISVYFECCHAYQRIYRNQPGTAYEGYCPKCSKPVRVKIGPGGTDARFFSAG